MTQSELVREPVSTDRFQGYFPKVVYAFSVDNHKYIGQTVSFVPRISSRQGEIKTPDGRPPAPLRLQERPTEVLAKYPVGAQVTVHYNPKDPALCTLETGFSKLMVFGVLGCTLFSALCGWMLGFFACVLLAVWGDSCDSKNIASEMDLQNVQMNQRVRMTFFGTFLLPWNCAVCWMLYRLYARADRLGLSSIPTFQCAAIIVVLTVIYCLLSWRLMKTGTYRDFLRNSEKVQKNDIGQSDGEEPGSL